MVSTFFGFRSPSKSADASTGAAAEGIQLTDLPDGVVGRILQLLDASALSSAEWVCKRFRTLVVEYQLWRDICYRESAECRRLSIKIAHSHNGTPGKRSAAFYHLHAQLMAPWEVHNILAEAEAASSTDNVEENAANVLTTLHRFNPMLGIRTRAYWSSKGSAAEDSAEWLLLRLAHPACLVRSVAVRPFRATFQRGHPLYSSKEVRFVFSCGSRTALKDRESLLRETRVQWAGLWQGNEDSKWLQGFEVASETFTMQQKDELQVFTFREPILCVGGLLKVELQGRVQKQEQDNAWYTCINYIGVSGKPLYGFVPCRQAGDRPSAGLCLRQVHRAEDPLVASGGLMRMAEGGLLQERLAVEEQGGNITDSDDEADAVDAEGVPLFMWQALGDFGVVQPQAPHGPGVEVHEAPGDPQ